MKTAVTDFILLGILSGLTSGAGVLPDGPLTAGGTVMFTTTRTPSNKPFVLISWIFTHNNIDTSIITSTSTDSIGPDYVGRITLSKSTGSLELRNLTLSDSGGYRVTLTVDGGNQETGSTRLEILVPVSNVMITVSDIDLVEFNSSVRLSCSSSGSSLSFLWLNGSSVVTARDRVQLTDGGSTLTIVNVTRYDQGPFRCKVSNAVSNGTSEPVKLSISYGPDDVNLKKSLSPEECVVGSNVDLSCSAVSSPSAQFSWFLNGSMLPEAGPELRLMNIQMNQSGSYSCQAFNNKTLRYKTSQPAAIIVIASPIQQSPTCSAGCIAGIVITCCVIVGACAVAGYFIFYKKKLRKASTNITSEHQDTAANSRNQELNYANVSTLQNRDGGIVQLGLQNNSTEYAQIRLNSFPAASSPPTYDVHMQRMKRQAPQPGANGAQANTHVYIDKLVRSDSHQM